MTKNSFVLQTRLKAVVAKLSDKQAGVLLKSILDYADDGTVANLDDGMVAVVFEMVKQDIDYNSAKYADTCEKRKAAIQKRWSNTKNTNVYKCIQSHTKPYKQIHNDNDVDNDVDVDNDIHTSINTCENIKINNLPNYQQCECVSESTGEQCLRKATYEINGKRYCNQHSKSEISKLEQYDITPKRFIKPTVEEIRSYCESRKNGIDAQAFFDFYESKGWKVGNSPMKNWQAAVNTWERRKKQEATNGTDYNKQPESGKYVGFGRKIGD